ncbi:MAG: HD-GYP domain-containing protein [Syntrophobacteraceae bacterium]
MPDDGGMSEESDAAFRNYRKQQWIFRPVQQTVLFSTRSHAVWEVAPKDHFMTTDCPKFLVVDASDQDFSAITRGYLPIKVRSLFPMTTVPCDIFSLARSSRTGGLCLKKLVDAGNRHELSLHRHMLAKEMESLYIRTEDEQAFSEYFNKNVQQALSSGSAPPEQKAELLYDQADYVVQKVFRERPTPANVRLGQDVVAHLSRQAICDGVTLRAMLSLFSKDYYTFTHCIQVSILGMAFCKHLGWTAAAMEDFGMGALFHDIGKSGIDDRILNKPGKLDKEEFELIKKHPLLGYQQIRATQVMNREQLNVVLQHHEALDGSGYPYGLKAPAIGKIARVARIIDVFDALTTKRAYKDALPPSKALRIMNNEMRATLDDSLFEAFIKFQDAGTGRKTVESCPEPLPGFEKGTVVRVRCDGDPSSFEGVVAASAPERGIVLKLSHPIDGSRTPRRNAEAKIQRLHSGADCSFPVRVIKYVEHPAPLLHVAPIEGPREKGASEPQGIECAVSVQAAVGSRRLPGAITTLSRDNCTVVIQLLPGGAPTVGLTAGSEVSIFANIGPKGRYDCLKGVVRHSEFEDDAVVLEVQFGASHPEIAPVED